MFETIQIASPDPILGLLDIFITDQRREKINLGIGVYQDEDGSTPILPSVKKAELMLIKHEASKNYLKIEGIDDFANSTQHLLFGKNNNIIYHKRAKSAQTPGGTGALRIAGDFLKINTNAKRIWISNPGWINHKNVFKAAQLEVCYYTYYNSITHNLDFDGMLSDLKKVSPGDVVLFHGCCHNPTGIDPTIKQWRILAELSIQNDWMPLFDFAYQGFAYGLENDVKGLQIFCETHQELIVCNSYSKNFGLYNERVGACTLIAANNTIAERAFSQLKTIIRANYSNPPAHGAKIVTSILNTDFLHSMWKEDLCKIRKRIKCMRQLFVDTLHKQGSSQDFGFINQQHGMFSFSGLSINQVLKLREKSGVYMLDSGRINIAGITIENVIPLCKAIINIL